MDKNKLVKAIQNSQIETVVIGSTASKVEKEAQLRSFNKLVSHIQSGEIILVVIQR